MMVRSRSFSSDVCRNIQVQVLVLVVFVAFLAPVCSAIHFTNTDWDARPGELLHLTWVDQVKWATITLMSGQPEHSQTEGNDPIISYSQELELQWRVPDDKPEGDYFLLIHDLSGNTNYSPVFRLAPKIPGSITASGVTITGLTFTTSVVYFSSSTLSQVTATPTDDSLAQQPTDSNDATQSTSEPQTSSSDLSAGAQAGIALGGTIGILLLLGGMSYFFYRRGKAVGASKQVHGATDTSSSRLSRWRNPWKRRRLHSRASSSSEVEAGKFRPPSPTPKELSGEDKLPPELASDARPTEIGTDWPVVAELSAGELCMEEMERECGEIKFGSLSSSSESGRSEKHVAVSPLTPASLDSDANNKEKKDSRENEKCQRDTRSNSGDDKNGRDDGTSPDTKAVEVEMEIQIQLKDSDDQGKKG